jgi:hypothetical protein
MSSHTPAPWSYYDASECGITKDTSLFPFAISAQHPEKPNRKVTFAQVDGFSKQESEANARLIAAAPELLEALRNLEACVHDYFDAEKRIEGPARLPSMAEAQCVAKAGQLARSAIAKATVA